CLLSFFFLFIATATTEIYTLSLHDALPIWEGEEIFKRLWNTRSMPGYSLNAVFLDRVLGSMSMADRDLRWTEWLRRERSSILSRSEEHTSELQSRGHLVCRLLLEKKNKIRE